MVGVTSCEVEVQDFGRDGPPANAALGSVPGSLARFWELQHARDEPLLLYSDVSGEYKRRVFLLCLIYKTHTTQFQPSTTHHRRAPLIPLLHISAMESTMQQRRDEILAKKAKLAELKRQRELRKQESASRQSLSGSPLAEVRRNTPLEFTTHY
jgi:hypothetical protein